MPVSTPIQSSVDQSVLPPVWAAGDDDTPSGEGEGNNSGKNEEPLPAESGEGGAGDVGDADGGKPLLDAFDELEQDEKQSVLGVLNQILGGGKPGKD